MNLDYLSNDFHDNGFIHGIDILTLEESRQLYNDFTTYEQRVKCNDVIPADYRFELHLLTKWANQIIRHPKILCIVSKLLSTDNLVVWSTDLNLKRPKSKGFFSWHQDSLYAGFSPPDKFITVWLAITTSKKENGCVCFLPKTQGKQLRHKVTSSENNMLSLGQTIEDEEFLQKNIPNKVHAELRPGQISIHSSLAVHASGPNNSENIRAGLAIRYVADDVKRIKESYKQPVQLVKGVSTNESFELLGEIDDDFSEKALENHKRVMDISKQIYFDEINGAFKNQ